MSHDTAELDFNHLSFETVRADSVMAQSIRLVIRGVQKETNCLVNRA